MSSTSALDVKSRRLRRDEQELAAAQKDLADLDDDITSTKQKVELLTQKLRESEALRLQLASYNEDLYQRVQIQARSLRPFYCLPDEILRLIFTQLADELDEMWKAGYYNESRARRPFIVSAVCRLWRSVAVNSPGIWVYAGVPNLTKTPQLSESTVARIRLVTQRSGKMPIDVIIEEIEELVPAYIEILEILYPELYRWRKCDLYTTLPNPTLLPYVRGSAPLLEELYITQKEGRTQNRDDLSQYLLNSRLKHFVAENAHFLPKDCSRLESAILTISEPLELWAFLNKTQCLVSLDIQCSRLADLGTVRLDSVNLANLRTLHLRGDTPRALVSQPTLLVVPSLTSLVIEREWTRTTAGDRLRDLGPFLDHVHDTAKGLSEICLASASLCRDDADLLSAHRLFKSMITVLKFNQCTIKGEFWSAFASGPGTLDALVTLDVVSTTMESGSMGCFFEFVFWMKRHVRTLPHVNLDKCTGVSARDEAELRSQYLAAAGSETGTTKDTEA